MTQDGARASRILLLPGWQNAGVDHWQSRWEALHGDVRVEQDDWQWPRRGDWMARLDEVLLEEGVRAVLVAHGLGCQLVAAWAAHSQLTHLARAALLVAPPDTEGLGTPPQLFNWRPMARRRLPFASLMVTGRDDPHCSPHRAFEMARDWGSETLEMGTRGHFDGGSGVGDWPQGRALLEALMARTH